MNELNKKLIGRILMMVLSSLVIIGLYQSLVSFRGIRENSGFVIGKIIENKKSRYWISTYYYEVENIAYYGAQSGKFLVGSECLIIYDTLKPKFSLIANYRNAIHSLEGTKNKIDTALVKYRWIDYKPISEIKSFKDLWYLD